MRARRSTGEAAAQRSRIAVAEEIDDREHPGSQAQRHEDAVRRKRPHEEVVALAHLAREVGLIEILGVAVLEVHVVDEADGEHAEQRRGGEPRAAVVLPQRPEPAEPEHREQRRGEPGEVAPASGELPGEVVPERRQLPAEEGRLPVEQVRLPVLHPVEHILKRLAEEADRLALVDRRVLPGAHGQPDVVEGNSHDHGEDAEIYQRIARRPPERVAEDPGGEEQEHRSGRAIAAGRHVQPLAAHRQEQEVEGHDRPGPDRDPPVGPEDVDRQRGQREKPHQVVGGGEGQHVGDEHEPAVAVRAGLIVAPADHQVHHHGDGEERDGVHLLVHDRLVPDRPQGGARQRTAERGAVARPAMRHDPPEPLLGHQEPERGSAGAGRGGEQVDPRGILRGQRQQAEGVRQDHEERVARRVRNPEHPGRGDVFGGVPEGGRRRQGNDVDQEHDGERHERPEVGRPLLRRVGHRSGVSGGIAGGRSSPSPFHGDWPPRSPGRRGRSRPAG